MIKSMTGFASLTRDDERGAIGVTIRSVNHRFLDLQLRLPPSIADLEPRLRALVQKHLARGRVEISVSLQLRQDAGAADRAERRVRAGAGRRRWSRRAAAAWSTATLTPGDLLRLPQALSIREKLPESGGVSAMLGTRGRRCGRERDRRSSKRCGCGKACTCAPISTRARRCWPA